MTDKIYFNETKGKCGIHIKMYTNTENPEMVFDVYEDGKCLAPNLTQNNAIRIATALVFTKTEMGWE